MRGLLHPPLGTAWYSVRVRDTPPIWLLRLKVGHRPDTSGDTERYREEPPPSTGSSYQWQYTGLAYRESAFESRRVHQPWLLGLKVGYHPYKMGDMGQYHEEPPMGVWC